MKLNANENEVLLELINYFDLHDKYLLSPQKEKLDLSMLEEDLIIDLRELCSDYLTEVGFDENYSVNSKGSILEGLIDKLYIE